MNAKEVRELLKLVGRTPNKRLGQNFLIDTSVVQATIRAGVVKEGDTILEIGPGLGVLTKALLDCGATVIAIEQDRAFADLLNATYHDRTLQVVSGDATRIDWSTLLPRTPWKLIANLPYGITSFILRKALTMENVPQTICVLIQREVAERAMAMLGRGKRAKRNVKPDASLLGLMIALYAKHAGIVRKVPARCFYPAPKVESVVFEITPFRDAECIDQWGIDPEHVMRIAKRGFAHPRKLLVSNLADGSTREVPLSKQDVESILVRIDANPKARPEDLTVPEWVELAKRLSDRKGDS